MRRLLRWLIEPLMSTTQVMSVESIDEQIAHVASKLARCHPDHRQAYLDHIDRWLDARNRLVEAQRLESLLR